VAKDRASPFSLRHSRYFLPVTGGMIFIGSVNIAIGYFMAPKEKLPSENQRIELVIPKSEFKWDAPGAEYDSAPLDAPLSDAPLSDASGSGSNAPH
jgi:hypothetical protein